MLHYNISGVCYILDKANQTFVKVIQSTTASKAQPNYNNV